jgi:hypothetical protein
MEISSEGLKIVSNCAKEKGCGHYPIFDPRCLASQKDDIIDCCKKSCLTNQSTDCEHNFCDDFYTYLARGVQSPLASVKNNYNLNREVFADQEHDNPTYAFYILFVVLAIIGLYIIHSILNKNEKLFRT